jgi:hypothetical protein
LGISTFVPSIFASLVDSPILSITSSAGFVGFVARTPVSLIHSREGRMREPVDQQRCALSRDGRGDLASEVSAGALEVFQHGPRPILPLGLAVHRSDRDHQPRGVGEGCDVDDVQVPERAVAALGEHLVERDGHLPAELAGLAVDRPSLGTESEPPNEPGTGRVVPPAVAISTRGEPWIQAVVLAELGAQATDPILGRKMVSHDRSHE